MGAAPDIPLPYRIVALMQERNRLFSYPVDRLEEVIRAYGFRCTGCGKCCTRSWNDHVFLLDRDADAAREIDSGSFEPAPDPEFCDRNGTLYVSGYALRRRDDDKESCWFLENNRCRIYDSRFSVCRIYPHMLRPAPDAQEDDMTWRYFARPDEHGEYRRAIPDEECRALARGILEYENAFLSQQIAFFETVHEYFSVHGQRHDPDLHGSQVQRHLRGEQVRIMVYHNGELENWQETKESLCAGCRGTATESPTETISG